MLGKIRFPTMVVVVSCPPIQSMVVVTSPMGDHAPPALAAMTTMPAKSQRVCRDCSMSWSKEHHNRRGQIVEQCREKERQHADDPKHLDLVPGSDAVCDHPESFVCIDEFHNGHRLHQEEQNAADLLHVVKQSVLKELGQTTVPLIDVIGRKQMEFFREVGRHIMPTKDKQRPAHGACHQSRSGLVDVDVVFEGNEGVAQDENDENENVHGCHGKGKNAFNVRSVQSMRLILRQEKFSARSKALAVT